MINKINKLANFNVSGIDKFPSYIVTLSCKFIYKPLTYICNLSFSDANVPRTLKVSKLYLYLRKDQGIHQVTIDQLV